MQEPAIPDWAITGQAGVSWPDLWVCGWQKPASWQHCLSDYLSLLPQSRCSDGEDMGLPGTLHDI